MSYNYVSLQTFHKVLQCLILFFLRIGRRFWQLSKLSDVADYNWGLKFPFLYVFPEWAEGSAFKLGNLPNYQIHRMIIAG